MTKPLYATRFGAEVGFVLKSSAPTDLSVTRKPSEVGKEEETQKKERNRFPFLFSTQTH